MKARLLVLLSSLRLWKRFRTVEQTVQILHACEGCGVAVVMTHRSVRWIARNGSVHVSCGWCERRLLSKGFQRVDRPGIAKGAAK
jgi:hypothetical protein